MLVLFRYIALQFGNSVVPRFVVVMVVCGVVAASIDMIAVVAVIRSAVA